MVSFFERLFNKNNIVNPSQELPQFKNMQMREDGSMYEAASPTSDKPASPWQKLSYALIGVPVQSQSDSIGTATDEQGNVIQSANISNPIRQGGFLRDLTSGYKENIHQDFSLDNWGQNKGGIARHLGEGLGSLVKFAESPAGRALLTGAAVGLTGGNGLQALTYGTVAGAKNQTNRMADKIYRDDLIRSYQDSLINSEKYQKAEPEVQQEMLADIADKINNVRGYINNDVYTNMLRSKQLQDNAEYRKMYYDTQLENNKINQALAREKLDYQKEQDKADRAYKYAELGEKRRANDMTNAMAYQKMLQDNNKGNKYENPKIILNNVEKLWRLTPQGRAWKGTSKGKAIQTGIANFIGLSNNDVSAYNAIAESMVTPLARQISQEKGNVSDKDIARARAMLPQITDSYEQGMAKINAIRELIQDLEQGNTKGKDSLGIL